MRRPHERPALPLVPRQPPRLASSDMSTQVAPAAKHVTTHPRKERPMSKDTQRELLERMKQSPARGIAAVLTGKRPTDVLADEPQRPGKNISPLEGRIPPAAPLKDDSRRDLLEQLL